MITFFVFFFLGGATGYAFGALNQAVCWRWLFRSLGIVGFLMVFVVLLIIRDPGQQKDDTVKTIKPQKSDYTLKVNCKKKSNTFI